MFTKIMVHEVMRDIIRCQILYKKEKNLYEVLYNIFSYKYQNMCYTYTYGATRRHNSKAER